MEEQFQLIEQEMERESNCQCACPLHFMTEATSMEKAIMDKPVREDSGFYLLGGNIDSEQTRLAHPGNLIKEH